jgi:hypothetical protein
MQSSFVVLHYSYLPEADKFRHSSRLRRVKFRMSLIVPVSKPPVLSQKKSGLSRNTRYRTVASAVGSADVETSPAPEGRGGQTRRNQIFDASMAGYAVKTTKSS